jgi:transcription antitermination factor NusG
VRAEQIRKQWHVVYTRSRAEKKVYKELTDCNIEAFMPIQKQLRQWKDRKKWVEVPLLSGYCFVNISRKEYDQVLQNPHVVCFLTFEGKAAVVPPAQIETMQAFVQQYDFEVQVSHENFEEGQQVEIIKGALVGLKGELIDIRGKHRFIIRIKEIDTSFSVEIPSDYLTRNE